MKATAAQWTSVKQMNKKLKEPGADPTTYNASVVKNYSAANGMAHSYNKTNFYLT
jgi:hypothetical protein